MPREPGLLQACEQLREEATAVYYGASVFYAPSTMHFVVWLTAIGEKKRALVSELRGFRSSKFPGSKHHISNNLALENVRVVKRVLETFRVLVRENAFRYSQIIGEQLVHRSEAAIIAVMTPEDWQEYAERTKRLLP